MRKSNSEINATSIGSTLTTDDLKILLGSDTGAAQVHELINQFKRTLVSEQHPRQIFQVKPNKNYKNGCFKTYVYIDGKRKEMTALTEDKLIDKLYVFYKESSSRTLEQVFEMLIEYKTNCLNRSPNTEADERSLFKFLSDELKTAWIDDIGDEDIRRWIVSDYLKTFPKATRMKKLFQLLNQIFEYGIRKKLCIENPMRFITFRDYAQFCNNSKKLNEEKAFSKEELRLLSQNGLKNSSNPRCLMALLAKETGLRAGELAALHKEDIHDGFIHVHRQQLRTKGPNSSYEFHEVPYTKDEKTNPHGGRYVPLTDEANEVLRLASLIPGESDYVFHDPNSSEMVTKDSYEHLLRKHCQKLGCVPTNNHAFRMAFNSRLIEMGFSPADRALILGHQVQTNETHYSLTDKRRLEDIMEKMTKKEKPL